MKALFLTLAGTTPWVLSACSEAHHTAKHEEPPPPAQVTVARIDAASLQGGEEVVGTVRAALSATLEAKVSGRISKLAVRAGDSVKQGDLIATLEVAEVEAKLAQAQAVLERSRSEFERYENLLAKDAVTRQQFDQVATQYRVAQANVREARSIFDYARVRAPFDGVITQKIADLGDLATPGRPLVRLEDPKRYRLEVAVPETLSRFVGIGAAIPVRIQDEAHEAYVAEIAPSTDPNSRTLLVKLDLPDTADVKTGQFGRAIVPTGRTSVLQVPRSAVVKRGQLELVFVVRESQAKMRLVKTGKHVGERVEIVSGIDSGETIVIRGAKTLVDGQPLEVQS